MNEVAKIKRKPFACTGTLDLECHDWDQFAIGAVYDGRRLRFFYDLDELIDHLRRVGGTFWAHAGGVFDFLAILDRLEDRGIACQVDRSQHRVTRIVIGGLTLRDSYQLWPAPLDDLCGAVGMAVPELPWPCVCGKESSDGRGCGGFCQIGIRAAAGDPDLEDYVGKDCVALYRALGRLDGFTSDHGIALRGTLGQTAWISAQDELGVEDSTIPFHLWRHARQADKGGRSAIVRPRIGDVLRPGTPRRGRPPVAGVHHDICSAYPASLARAELPVGACSEIGGASAQAALERGQPGVYTVQVHVPEDSFLPPLPWAKAGQMCFPTGEFSGSWVLPELVAALDRGVRLLAVHTALVWEATALIFAPLVERWYEIRKSAGKKTPLGQWVSRLSKALPGKFAERPDKQRMMFHPADVKICTRRGQCNRGCTKRCGAYEQLDLFGHIWAIPYQRMSPSAYPQWSAYLRAMTRVQWLSQAERMTADPDGRPDGGKAVCMGNTDSLWSTSRQKPDPIGDGIGEWEYQCGFTDLEIRSATNYAYRDASTGKLVIHGVPGITEDDWKRGSGRIDRGIVTIGTAVKGSEGLFKKRTRNWSLPKRDRQWYGDRLLHSDGLTYPATAEQLRELSKVQDQNRKRVEYAGDEDAVVDTGGEAVDEVRGAREVGADPGRPRSKKRKRKRSR